MNLRATMALSAVAAVLLIASPSSADNGNEHGGGNDDNKGHGVCIHGCVSDAHSCTSDAQSEFKMCVGQCTPLRDAISNACGHGFPDDGLFGRSASSQACKDAVHAFHACVDPCQDAYWSSRTMCIQDLQQCIFGCISGTPTPAPTNTPEPTLTETPVPTETSAPPPTETVAEETTSTPTATSTSVVAPTETPTPQATETAAPAFTETSTPAVTVTNTAAPTETSTPVPPTGTAPPTATSTAASTDTSTPAPTATLTATNTPAPTSTATEVPPTPTATATETPAGLSLTCNFASGTHVALNDGSVAVNINLTGHQELVFSASDANGVRTISIPASGGHFDCAALPLNSGIACARPDPSMDGSGLIDCDGTAGTSGYDITAEQDHNSNNGNNPGFDPDATCSATFTEPDGTTAAALTEDGSSAHPHTGVCNSPIHITTSGTFPAGGMLLNQHLILRLDQTVTTCSPGACPADNAPFDDSQGDTRFFPVLTTGMAAATVHDQNNGTGDLTANVTGAVQSCAAIDANDLSTGMTVAGLPALDLPVLSDSNALFSIKCQ